MIRLALLQRGPGLQLVLDAVREAAELNIVAVLESASRLVEKTEQLGVQALLVDLDDVGWDGVKIAEELMTTRPIPVMALDRGGASQRAASFLAAGGVGIVVPTRAQDFFLPGLGQQILALAEVKVVRRRTPSGSIPKPNSGPPLGSPTRAPSAKLLPFSSDSVVGDGVKPSSRLVVIGASTGGPSVLQGLLTAWAGKVFPPILIAQHISEGFGPSMVQWLQTSTGFKCCVATDSMILQSGCAYFAPDGQHLGVGCLGGTYHARVFAPSPMENCFPSANVLFQTASEVAGRHCIALLLTGMGRDGADGLLAVRRAGGTTFTQTASTCAVFGMPGEAVKLNASMFNLDPADLASETVRLLSF